MDNRCALEGIYDDRIRKGKAFVKKYIDCVDLIIFDEVVCSIYKTGSYIVNTELEMDLLFSNTCAKYIREFYKQYRNYFNYERR